jgi:hypothetical protein
MAGRIGVRKHAVLWTAMPGHDAEGVACTSVQPPVFHIQLSNSSARRHGGSRKSRVSSPVLFGEAPGRPVFRLSPLKDEGMARQGAHPLFFVCPHSLSEMRGAARRATRTSLRTSGFICGRLPYGAGPRFSWPPVKHGTASVSQAPGGRLLLATRRSPGAARVRALRGHARGRRIRSHPHDAS